MDRRAFLGAAGAAAVMVPGAYVVGSRRAAAAPHIAIRADVDKDGGLKSTLKFIGGAPKSDYGFRYCSFGLVEGETRRVREELEQSYEALIPVKPALQHCWRPGNWVTVEMPGLVAAKEASAFDHDEAFFGQFSETRWTHPAPIVTTGRQVGKSLQMIDYALRASTVVQFETPMLLACDSSSRILMLELLDGVEQSIALLKPKYKHVWSWVRAMAYASRMHAVVAASNHEADDQGRLNIDVEHSWSWPTIWDVELPQPPVKLTHQVWDYSWRRDGEIKA